MEDYWKKASSWYDYANPGESYAYMMTRWGAMMAAYSKAMGSLFELAAKYQEEATRDMARLGKDPMSAMDVYWSIIGRKMELWNELQPIMERMQKDADLMYERIRRDVDGGGDSGAAAGGSSGGAASGAYGSGGGVKPERRYGSAAAEGSPGRGSSAAREGAPRPSYGAPSGAASEPKPGAESGTQGGYRRVAKVKP